VKEAWSSLSKNQDPRDFWEAAWRRVTRVMIAEKRHIKEKQAYLSDLRTELESLRHQVTPNSSLEDRIKLKTVETQARDAERREAIIWRCQSRIKWLSVGEAPSTYFFAQMRGKHL
jgi:hypothetical protein